MTEDAEELIKCPSCSKKFFISSFKINRLGQRLRTCSGCLARQKEEREKQKCIHGKAHCVCCKKRREPICLHRKYGDKCEKCLTQWRIKEEQIQAEEVLKRKHRPPEMALLETIKKQTKKVLNTQTGALDHLECTISQFREYIEKLCQPTETINPPAKDTDIMNWGNFTVIPSKYWNQNQATPFKDRKWSIMPEILELKYTTYTPVWCSDWKKQLTVKKANRAELLKR